MTQDIENHPLGWLLYLAVLALVSASLMGNSKYGVALFLSTWTAAFFAYRSVRLLSENFRLSEKSHASDRFEWALKTITDNTSNSNESIKKAALVALDSVVRPYGEYKAVGFEVVCDSIKTSFKTKEIRQRAIDLFLKKRDEDSEYLYQELKANLSHAPLDGLDLKKVQLQGSTLTQASMSGAVFSDESDFSGAEMTGVSLSGVGEIRGNFTDCDFKKATITQSWFKESILDGADFSEAIVSSSSLDCAKSAKNMIVPAAIYNSFSQEFKEKNKLKKGESFP